MHWCYVHINYCVCYPQNKYIVDLPISRMESARSKICRRRYQNALVTKFTYASSIWIVESLLVVHTMNKIFLVVSQEWSQEQQTNWGLVRMNQLLRVTTMAFVLKTSSFNQTYGERIVMNSAWRNYSNKSENCCESVLWTAISNRGPTLTILTTISQHESCFNA
jgi:hypothetical protein